MSTLLAYLILSFYVGSSLIACLGFYFYIKGLVSLLLLSFSRREINPPPKKENPRTSKRKRGNLDSISVKSDFSEDYKLPDFYWSN